MVIAFTVLVCVVLLITILGIVGFAFRGVRSAGEVDTEQRLSSQRRRTLLRMAQAHVRHTAPR